MSNLAPLFPVPSNSNPKSLEENVSDLSKLCHVVEVKAPYALVHASPIGVARIASELGLEVFPSKRGGEYYAVRVAAVTRPVLVRNNQAPVPAPVPNKSTIGTTSRLNINGGEYLVKETPCKRRIDLRRWEVRKLGDEINPPYVVTFQATDGHEAQCGCKDWIYRRHQCKHIKAIQAAFAARNNSRSNVA